MLYLPLNVSRADVVVCVQCGGQQGPLVAEQLTGTPDCRKRHQGFNGVDAPDTRFVSSCLPAAAAAAVHTCLMGVVKSTASTIIIRFICTAQHQRCRDRHGTGLHCAVSLLPHR
jgi:hypothetical protein